jgi:hypothetical protein
MNDFQETTRSMNSLLLQHVRIVDKFSVAPPTTCVPIIVDVNVECDDDRFYLSVI